MYDIWKSLANPYISTLGINAFSFVSDEATMKLVDVKM